MTGFQTCALPIFQIEGDDSIQGLAECRKSIIGKVAGDKVANLAGMTSFTNNMRTFAKNLIVVEIGVNLFQFTFASLHDRDRVLGGRPWVYDNQPLVVLPWREGLEGESKAFNSTWIWIQIWNLPIH